MIAREIAFIIAIYFLLVFAVYCAAHVLVIKPRIHVRQCEFVVVRAKMIHAFPLSGQIPGPLFLTGLFFSLFSIFSIPYSLIKFGKKNAKRVLLIQVAIPLSLILLIELIRNSTSLFDGWTSYEGGADILLDWLFSCFADRHWSICFAARLFNGSKSVCWRKCSGTRQV